MIVNDIHIIIIIVIVLMSAPSVPSIVVTIGMYIYHNQFEATLPAPLLLQHATHNMHMNNLLVDMRSLKPSHVQLLAPKVHDTDDTNRTMAVKESGCRDKPHGS